MRELPEQGKAVGKMLYVFHFDLNEFRSVLILLVLAVAGFAFYKFSANDWQKGLGLLAGIITAILFVFVTISHTWDYFEKKAALENGQYETVEGYVEKFHAMPPEGHDSEHFVIDGVYFQYTAFEERNGYHRPACQGGVITNDGQYLKIEYVTNKKGENVILSIEALDPSK